MAKAMQLQGLQEAISIHNGASNSRKGERTNVFNISQHWGASLRHVVKIHTHTHKAHHKYAFVPLLVEMGPGNILNVSLYISISILIALCGLCTQREVSGWRRDPVESCRKVVGQREWASGARGGQWYLLFHPPLYSSRHGNRPGGHSREASSVTKTTERQRVSGSKLVSTNESWQRKWAADL